MKGSSSLRHEGGLAVGLTRKGKGTKIMALADGAGLPLAVTVASANPSEISLVEDTLKNRFLRQLPTRIIGDRRYCRRSKIERLFAWLQNVRRLVTRHERHVENFPAFVQPACIIILSRQFVR